MEQGSRISCSLPEIRTVNRPEAIPTEPPIKLYDKTLLEESPEGTRPLGRPKTEVGG
jgi:hypothetical protein